jgi:hypothetical protein
MILKNIRIIINIRVMDKNESGLATMPRSTIKTKPS